MTGKPRNRALRARMRQLGADLTPLRSSGDFRLVVETASEVWG